MPSPSYKCLHPVRIFNKSLNRHLFVSCGHCEACANQKSTELKNRVTREIEHNSNALFFTLTYDNKNLPTILVSKYDYYLSKKSDLIDVVEKKSGELRKYPLGYFDCCKPPINYNSINEAYIEFGVLDKRDIQLFIKRLRKNVQKNFTGVDPKAVNLRYFVCGEYGPTTLRPHYHGIIWCSKREYTDYVSKVIPTCWKACSSVRIRPSYVQGAAGKYVSAYVTSSNSLPTILQQKPYRPFYLCSKNPLVGYGSIDEEWQKDVFFNANVTQGTYNSTKQEMSVTLLPYSIINHFFPKPQGYSMASKSDIYKLLHKYRQLEYDKEISSKGMSLNDRIYSPCFNYQDFRFYRFASNLIGKDFTYQKRDVNGRFIGTFITFLTEDEFVERFFNLYQTYNREKFKRWLLDVYSVDLSGFDNLYLHFDNLLDLPPSIVKFDDRFKAQKLLRLFGLKLKDVYDNYYLNKEFLDYFGYYSTNRIFKDYECEVKANYSERIKRKKYNSYKASIEKEASV